MCSVVAVLSVDQDCPLGLAQRSEVATRDFRGGVYGVSAAAGEEDLSFVQWGAVSDLVGQAQRRTVREVSEALIGLEFIELPGDGFDNLCPAMSHIGIPEAGCSIEIAIAGTVPQPHVVTMSDRDAGILYDMHVGERMPQGAGARLSSHR